MKNYISGVMISLVLLGILIIINSQVYSNTMNLSMLFTLLVLQVIFHKHLIRDKKRLPYLTLMIALIIFVFLSLPNLTSNQAKQKVTDVYGIDIIESSIVPVQKEWNPFEPDSAYLFKGVNAKSEAVSIMVSASSGKMFVITP